MKESNQRPSPITSATSGFSRRAFLQGVGATVTLPFLESLARAAEKTSGGDASSKAPVRYGVLLFSNGVDESNWWAKGRGDSMELSKSLKPLEAYKKDLTILSKMHLFPEQRKTGGHPPVFTNYLSGAPVRKGTRPDVGQTADQFLAERIGHKTSMGLLTLGTEPVLSGIRVGVPSICYHTISWKTRHTPVPPEIYPRQAFDSLFDRGGMLRTKSVLDSVLQQAKEVRGELSTADQKKLDEYMDSVRGVEKRVDRAMENRREDKWKPTLTEPNMDRPAEGRPADLPEHMKLMLDIIVLAWQMDKTRIATMLFESDATYDANFRFLEGVSGGALHGISHHGDKPERLEAHRKTNEFHAEMLKYMMDKMASIQEGPDTLLDNSMVLFGSNLADGNSHEARWLTCILAGHGGGSIAGGRALAPEKDSEQLLCNLHLAMIRRMGVDVESFGNSTGQTQGLE
jgi:hypothetical protein